MQVEERVMGHRGEVEEMETALAPQSVVVKRGLAPQIVAAGAGWLTPVVVVGVVVFVVSSEKVAFPTLSTPAYLAWWVVAS